MAIRNFDLSVKSISAIHNYRLTHEMENQSEALEAMLREWSNVMKALDAESKTTNESTDDTENVQQEA